MNLSREGWGWRVPVWWVRVGRPPRLGTPYLGGIAAIVLVAGIFGYGNVVVREAEQWAPATGVMAIRYLVGTLLTLPLVGRHLNRGQSHGQLTALGLGAALGLGTVFQAWSMETIPLAEMAFISALYVVLTPMVSGGMARRLPSVRVGIAVVASLLGLALVMGPHLWRPGPGIWWALAAAVALTAQIVGSTHLVRTLPPLELAWWEMAGAALSLATMAVIQGQGGATVEAVLTRNLSPLWAVGYLGIVGTVVAFWLQMWGQARVPASTAALGFNLEPVFTVVAAWLWLGQTLTPTQLVGGAVAFSALVAVGQDGEPLPLPKGAAGLPTSATLPEADADS
jgi:drug/metabolite transporter (DMT)-like permease